MEYKEITPEERARPLRNRRRELELEAAGHEASLVSPRPGDNTEPAKTRLTQIESDVKELDKAIDKLAPAAS